MNTIPYAKIIVFVLLLSLLYNVYHTTKSNRCNTYGSSEIICRCDGPDGVMLQ